MAEIREDELQALRQELAARRRTIALLQEEAHARAALVTQLQRTVREQKAELDEVHSALGAAAAKSKAQPPMKVMKGTSKGQAKGTLPPPAHRRALGGRAKLIKAAIKAMKKEKERGARSSSGVSPVLRSRVTAACRRVGR